MKCQQCGREIALAKKCPYCGHPAPENHEEKKATGRQGFAGRGVFRGRVSSRRRSRGWERSMFGILPAVFRYFKDPHIASWRKLAILAGVLYVVSPVDLIPGATFPVIGWIDDAVVAAFTWKLLRNELDRHNDDREA